MWNLDTIVTHYMIPMPIFREYQTIVRKNLDGLNKLRIMISYLSQDDENLIDAGKSIKIKRGALTFNLSPKDIEFYGDVDFSNNSEDLEEIDEVNWLNNFADVTVPIPSNYNYEKHACKSKELRYFWTETVSPAKLVQYAHGCLGKPKKVVIFKHKYYGKF